MEPGDLERVLLALAGLVGAFAALAGAVRGPLKKGLEEQQEKERQPHTEIWRLKDDAERRADEWEEDAERWKDAYYALQNYSSGLLSRLQNGVRVVLILMTNSSHTSAKDELHKLNEELERAKLPEPPKS